MRKPTKLLFGGVLSVGLWACASAPPPAPVATVVAAPAQDGPKPEASAASAAAAAPVEPAASNDAAPPVAANAEADKPAAAADNGDESSRPGRSPIDVITSTDTAFLINYSGSAPIESARRTCAEKSAGDPEVEAKCLSDARAAFKADVIRFRKQGTHWSWTVYKRDGSRLDEVTSGRVELSEASPNSVKIKFVSDKGLRPLFKNKREALLTVPNDYSFEVDDADWGKLEYEAKIGLVAN